MLLAGFLFFFAVSVFLFFKGKQWAAVLQRNNHTPTLPISQTCDAGQTAFTQGIRAPKVKDRKRRLPAQVPHRRAPNQNSSLVPPSVWTECHPDVLACLQRLLVQDRSVGKKAIQSCRLVNRHWYRAFCKSMVELAPKLRVFTFWDLGALQKFSNLKKLTLRDDNIVSDSWLHELPKVTPQLETLVLRFVVTSKRREAFTKDGIHSLLKLQQLKHLEIAGNHFCRKKCVKAISTMQNLTYLDFSENELEDACIPPLRDLVNLETLILGGNPQLTNRTIHCIRELSSLKHFSVRGCERMTDKGLAHLAELTTLTSLDLRTCGGIKGNGFAQCAQIPLQRLDLMGCIFLDDDGLTDLGQFKFLKFLDLRMCSRITDVGMECLKTLSSLVDLRIGSSLSIITNAGLSHLLQLPCLEQLTLFFMQHVSFQGLESVCLIETLKKLTVIQCARIDAAVIKKLQPRSPPDLIIDLYPCSGN